MLGSNEMENLEIMLCSALRKHIADNYADYPSQVFLKKGVANVIFEKMPVKKIRIYHVNRKALILRGMKMLDGGRQIAGEDIPSFYASSGGLYKNAILDVSFNKIVRPYMVKTRKTREDAFVEIEFSRAVSMDRIVLYTGKGQKGIPENCLAVDITTDSNRKVNVYSYQKIINEYAEKISREFTFPEATQEQVRRIAVVMLHLHNDSFKSIVKQLKALDEVGLSSAVVKDYVNGILYPSERQVTFGHGCRRTFNFWTDEEKKDYITKANAVIEMLRKEITPAVFYAYGTILGFIRERNYFIPHDYDLDVMLVAHRSDYASYDELEKAVIDALKRNGLTYIRVIRKYGGIFVKYQKSPRFDIYLCFEEDGLVERMGLYYRYDELDPPININVLGVDCLIPRNPFSFLDRAFGRDWRIPKDIQTGELRETILRNTMPESFDKAASLQSK